MPLRALASFGEGILEGRRLQNANRNPLGEAQLEFQMQQHRDGREYRDALTRQANAQADQMRLSTEAGRLELSQQQLADAQRLFYEMEHDATHIHGGLNQAFKDRAFRNRYVAAINAHPQARELLGGRELVDFEVFDADNPEELGALGWGAAEIADFKQRHGGGSDVMIPIVRNADGSTQPLDHPDFDDAVDAISEIEAWDIGRSLFRMPDVVQASFGELGGGELGGTMTIGSGGQADRPQSGLASIDPSMLGHLTVERESGGNAGAMNLNEPGGTASYGPLQFNTRGALPAWFQSDGAQFAPLFDGLEPGTPAFNERWQEVASDPDLGQALMASQQAYAERELFQPLAARAEGNGIDVSDAGVQEALFSMSVQHSPAGQTQILNTAMAYMGSGTDPLEALYRARTDYLRSNTQLDDRTIQNIEQHYEQEYQKARQLSARGQESRRAEEMPISTSALAAINPNAIRAAERVAAPPVELSNRQRANAARQEAFGVAEEPEPESEIEPRELSNRQIAQRARREARGDSQPADRDATLGFHSEDELLEARTSIARRIQEGKGVAPGVAKRAADNTEVVDDVFRTTTREQLSASGQAVLDGVERADERTFRSTSTVGRPDSNQRAHAFRLYATGLISRDEFIRYIDTGVLSSDAVALVERGMAEAGQTARTHITQQGQTQRNFQDNQRRLAEQEAERQAQALEDNRISPSQFTSTVSEIFPLAIRSGGFDISDRQLARLQETAESDLLELSRWNLPTYRGSEWGAADATSAYARLYQLNDEIANQTWFQSLRDGGRVSELRLGPWRGGPELHKDPVAVALAAQNGAMFETTRGIRRYVDAKERYRDMLNGAGLMDQVNNRRLEAEVMLLTDHTLRSQGGSWNSDEDRDAAMRYAMTQVELLNE